MSRKQRTRTVCVFAGDATVCCIWDSAGCISIRKSYGINYIDKSNIDQKKVIFAFKMILHIQLF